MASQVGLTLIKRFNYRGDATEEFSNTYHFSGSIPADDTAWKALADALIAQEKTCYPAVVAVVRAYGYNSDADDATAVWTYDYLAHGATVAGTLSPGSGQYTSGDTAVWVRWKTSRLNTKGKSIYLRKYFHQPIVAGGTPPSSDAVLTAQVTALNAFGTKLRDGTFLDGRTITARAHADTVTASSASAWVTTRTLKRRGKRPGS